MRLMVFLGVHATVERKLGYSFFRVINSSGSNDCDICHAVYVFIGEFILQTQNSSVLWTFLCFGRVAPMRKDLWQQTRYF